MAVVVQKVHVLSCSLSLIFHLVISGSKDLAESLDLHSTEPLGVIFSNCRSAHAPRREWIAMLAAVKNACGRWEPRKWACRDEGGWVGRTGKW
jgi:hypothetical protein